MKKLIVLEHNGGRLANQLWLLVSTLAYALERGYIYRNYSFYEYQNYFAIRTGNKMFDYIFCRLPRRVQRAIYRKYVSKIRVNHPILSSGNTIGVDRDAPWYLSPSHATNKDRAQLEDAEAREGDIYLADWLFRNPSGIVKYHATIVSMLRPKSALLRQVEHKISTIKVPGKKIIGVHFRQGDYLGHPDTSLRWTAADVAEKLRDYAATFKSSDSVIFIVCSDGPIDHAPFSGLHIEDGIGDAIPDLLLLSKCDAIIGVNSSFGTMASYLGNKPFMLLEHGPIDWMQYQGIDRYYEHPRATMTCY